MEIKIKLHLAPELGWYVFELFRSWYHFLHDWQEIYFWTIDLRNFSEITTGKRPFTTGHKPFSVADPGFPVGGVDLVGGR